MIWLKENDIITYNKANNIPYKIDIKKDKIIKTYTPKKQNRLFFNKTQLPILNEILRNINNKESISLLKLLKGELETLETITKIGIKLDTATLIYIMSDLYKDYYYFIKEIIGKMTLEPLKTFNIETLEKELKNDKTLLSILNDADENRIFLENAKALSLIIK